MFSEVRHLLDVFVT